MAERIVMAQFEVDTAGVVRGLRLVDENTKRTSQNVRSNLDAVTAKMFSARTAALRLAGAFGFGGIVFSLANAVATLAKELIAGTTFFKNLSEAATDLWRKFALGETQVERLGRKAEEFWKGTGVNSMQQNLAMQDKLREKILTGFNAVQKEGKITQEAWRAAAADIKAARVELEKIQLEAIKGGGGRVTPELLKSVQGREGVDITSGVRVDFSAGLDAGKILKPGEKTAEEIQKEAKAAAELARELEILRNLSVEGNPFMLLGLEIQHLKDQKTTEFLKQFDQLMIDIQHSTLGASAAFGAFGKFQEDSKIQAGFKAMAEGITLVNLAVETAGAAIESFVNKLSDALISGSFSGKKFFGEMLASMVPILLAYGALGLVRGFTGDPQGFVVAGIAFSAAAAAALAARALGVGKVPGGSSGGGGRGSVPAPAAASAGPNVTVNIQGSMIGTDRDTLARDLARLIETARGDGGR